MQTSKVLYKHIISGNIYAIEMTWDGKLVGCCGPLPKDNLLALDSYTYYSKINDWVRDNKEQLILMHNNVSNVDLGDD